MGLEVASVRFPYVPSLILRIAVTAASLLAVGCASQEKFVPFADLRAKSAVERGDRYIAQEDLDRALREFETAIELKPNLAVAHSKIGWIWRRKGDFEAAVRAYATAVRLDPFNFDDSMTLAEVYQQITRYSEAAQAYLHACELRPDHYEARLNLGACYHQANRIDEAIVTYRKATEIDGSQPAAYTNLGAIFDSQDKLYEAIHAYNESLERNPRQPMVLVNLAMTLLKQDRLGNAREALARAIEIDPRLALAHERMGYCCLRQRAMEDARQAYERAVELDPQMSDAHAGLGMVEMALYLEEPDRAELARSAMSRWQRSLELDPSQPKIAALVTKYRRVVEALTVQTQPADETSGVLASGTPEPVLAVPEPSAPHDVAAEVAEPASAEQSHADEQSSEQTQVVAGPPPVEVAQPLPDDPAPIVTTDNSAEALRQANAFVTADGEPSPVQLEAFAKLLKSSPAMVSTRDEQSRTLLMRAGERGRRPLVESLLDAGAEMDAVDGAGNTSTHLAAGAGETETVALLVDRGASVNARNAEGQTPLHLAVAAGHRLTAVFLVSKAIVNATDSEGRTPLHLAAAGGDATLVRLLLEWGADVNPRDAKLDRTPLHLATAAGQTDVVAALATKALLHPRDREGHTPLQLALQADHRKIVDILRQAGARE